MILPSTSSEDHEALNPVEFLELSVLKTIVIKLLLLRIGAISVMVPHNLTITPESESKTAKKEESAFAFRMTNWQCYLSTNTFVSPSM